jgi:hypothetical protein
MKIKKWASVTDIGKNFKMSGRAVNIFLEERGLRDNKQPTKLAFDTESAIHVNLKNGMSHFLWSTAKIESLLSEKYPKISLADRYVTDIVPYLKEACTESDRTGSKIAIIAYDMAFEDVPKNIRREVKNRVNSELGIVDE